MKLARLDTTRTIRGHQSGENPGGYKETEGESPETVAESLVSIDRPGPRPRQTPAFFLTPAPAPAPAWKSIKAGVYAGVILI